MKDCLLRSSTGGIIKYDREIMKEVLVDGKLHSSNLVPLFGDGLEHTVKVVPG